MRIAVIGTGIVGRTVAEGFAGTGHDVVVGTRDVQATLSRTESDAMGNPPFSQWQDQHENIPLKTFREAANGADIVVNATAGTGSVKALEEAGRQNLAGKVVMDVANPLDFSQGFPPTLSVCNTDSLAEQIQRTFADAKVVKALNTMNCRLMIDPSRISGDHDVFIAGEDGEAKETVKSLLRGLGWPEANIVDVGGIRAARGLEMYLPLWLSLMMQVGPDFNIHVVRAS